MARNLAGKLSTTWKENKVGGCANVLWTTFKAHKLMKEFLTSYDMSGHPKLAPYVLHFLVKNVASKQSVSTMFSQVEKKADKARKAAKEGQTTADKALSKNEASLSFFNEKEEVKVSSLKEDEHLGGQEC